jgi:hypothetical protein
MISRAGKNGAIAVPWHDRLGTQSVASGIITLCLSMTNNRSSIQIVVVDARVLL